MREQYLIDKKISNKESVHTKKTMICFSLRSNIILQNNNLTLSYDTSREKGERVSLNKRNEKFAYRLHSLKNLCIRINRSSLNWVNKSVLSILFSRIPCAIRWFQHNQDTQDIYLVAVTKKPRYNIYRSR